MSTKTAPINPRIAERRSKVREEQMRKRRRLFLVVIILIAFLAFAFYLTRTPILDVDTIEINGATTLTTEEIYEASQIRYGEPLVSVNTGDAAANIRKIPVIDTATVQRKWDGHIIITVTERTPVALAQHEDLRILRVDKDGRVLSQWNFGDPAFPLLGGVEVGEPGSFIEGSNGALEVAALATPGVRSRLVSITQDENGQITAKLHPQGTVIFGSSADLPAKMTALRTLLGQVDQTDIATINVSTPSTPVITRL